MLLQLWRLLRSAILTYIENIYTVESHLFRREPQSRGLCTVPHRTIDIFLTIRRLSSYDQSQHTIVSNYRLFLLLHPLGRRNNEIIVSYPGMLHYFLQGQSLFWICP